VGPATALPLAEGVTLTLTPAGDDRWSCGIVKSAAAGPAGAAEVLVEKLRDGRALTHPDFRLERHAVPPEAAGERPVGTDQTHESVVVGERVVVKWLRHVDDAVHPAPLTLAHLTEVAYQGVPRSYGTLLWRAPSGREVPCGSVAAYLPGARDGYEWCVELAADAISHRLEAAGGSTRDEWTATFPARLGRLTAGLHVALATPSSVLPASVGLADRGRVLGWHRAARHVLDDALAAAPGLDTAPAGPDGGPPPVAPTAALAAARDRLATALDGLAELAELAEDPPAVQRVHGDLHVGQVLRWSGGLAVVDFDGDPLTARLAAEGVDPLAQPAARDVAHLLVSIDQVGRIVDRLNGFAATAAVDAWSAAAREQLLAAYLDELATLGRSDLFDARLLAPFVAEQVCRDLVYAADHLPRWAYAVTGGLDLLLGGPG
jgi:maltokinase